MQKWADALGPGSFVMLGAFDALVIEVFAELPAFLQEDVAKLLDLLNNPRALVRSDVEPYAWPWLDGSGCREAMNNTLIPPYRRR